MIGVNYSSNFIQICNFNAVKDRKQSGNTVIDIPLCISHANESKNIIKLSVFTLYGLPE